MPVGMAFMSVAARALLTEQTQATPISAHHAAAIRRIVLTAGSLNEHLNTSAFFLILDVVLEDADFEPAWPFVVPPFLKCVEQHAALFKLTDIQHTVTPGAASWHGSGRAELPTDTGHITLRPFPDFLLDHPADATAQFRQPCV
jgi:hypothetical protein